MDKKFLSYFTADKASDKQSLYDMSHHNLLSGSFGGLTCTFWDKVLAKDYYKIAASTQSKGAALSSPTFTELKSNDYAFFAPCQILWKHWNDYFTNGTEFADTYGSNRNNQDLQGLWKEPQIPVNYLQFIGKVGKGYALPAYRFNFASVFDYFSREDSPIPDFYVLGATSNTVKVPIIDIFRLLVFKYPDLLSGLEGITIDPNPVIDVPLVGPDPMKTDFSNLALSDDPFYVYGSPDDVRNFQFFFMGGNLTITPPSLNQDNLTITSDTSLQDFVIFSDNTSSRPRFSESPFLITYKQKPVNLFGNNVSLSYVSYLKRLGITDKQEFSHKELMTYNNPLVEVKDSSFLTIRDKNFFYKSRITFSDIAFNGTYMSNNGILFGENMQYLIFNNNNDFDFSAFENDNFPVSFINHILDSGISTPYMFDNSINTNTPSVSPFDPYEPQQYFANGSNSPIYSPGLNVTFNTRYFYYNDIVGSTSQPPLVTLFHWVYQTTGYYGINPLLYDSQANVLGYTQFAFFIYLYQNCCKHLDYTGLPVDTFIPRSFKPYARERVSALPYFAYSKIWHEYFRNRTVSSPELDFSETNGTIFQGRNYVQYYNTYPQPLSPSEDPLEAYNSWVIPFSCTPKSGINDDLTQIDNNLYLNFENNLHYFNVTNISNMFALLTGYQLNMHILNQLISPLVTQGNYKYVAGFVYNHFVLPNYYNGLLHYKYQNFTKDYFSSALLDPMSGANQENVPQTVTELRTAQAKQSFWERTAVARSIKKFYEMMVGTTPTHIEYDKPLLLGSDHQNVQVSEVIQTSETDSTPLGTRAGIIADFGKGGLCSHFFNEPGIIMVLHSITVDAQYMQGLQKKFTPYDSYLDYPFTQFAHIGNESIFMRELNYTTNIVGTNNLSNTQAYLQARVKDTSGVVGIPRSSILNNPMYVSPNALPSVHPNMVEVTSDKLDSVFGYIPRFSYLKFAFDEVHGDFRDTMDYWHTFREFHYMPYLSHEFVNYESALRDSNLERIFAVLEDSDKFWQSIHFYITVKRSIPYYTVPKSSVN